MPEYRTPGVYIEELPGGPPPVQGVGTTTAGFVGCTERGPLRPIPVTSWYDYLRWYGGTPSPGDIDRTGYLAHAVQGFFLNGGQRAYVTRVTDSATAEKVARLTIGSSKTDSLTVTAIGPGNFGGNILVKIADRTGKGAPPNQPLFAISVAYYAGDIDAPTKGLETLPDPDDPGSLSMKGYRRPDLLERFDMLSLEPALPDHVETVVETGSVLIRVKVNGTPEVAELVKAAATYRQLAIDKPVAPKLPDVDSYAGVTLKHGAAKPSPPAEPVALTGLKALAAIDDISLLVVPDQGFDALHQPLAEAMRDFCAETGHCFAIAQFPRDAGPVAGMQPPVLSPDVAVYFPWLTVWSAETEAPIAVPPSGHIAGVYVRTDMERGVHKAPANEPVAGVIQRNVGGTGPLVDDITQSDQEILNPIGINCIRDFRREGRGILVWGARTTSSNGDWRYVPVRRLYLYLKRSLEIGTQWVVFEPNDEPTWTGVTASVSGFLNVTWRNGALMGSTPDQAYFVRCDRTTMTQDDIDNGRLIIEIGFAPVKPAEFIILRIMQKTADGGN